MGLAFFSVSIVMDVTECPVADDFFFCSLLENGLFIVSAEAREFRSTLLRAPGMTVGDELAFVRDDALAAHANALAGEC